MTEEEKKDFEKKDAEMCLRQEELRALYGTRLFMLKTEWDIWAALPASTTASRRHVGAILNRTLSLPTATRAEP